MEVKMEVPPTCFVKSKKRNTYAGSNSMLLRIIDPDSAYRKNKSCQLDFHIYEAHTKNRDDME